MGKIREGFTEDVASEPDHKGQMEGTLMERWENIIQIERRARGKKKVQDFKGHSMFREQKKHRCLGVNQRREQREDRSPDLDNQELAHRLKRWRTFKL